MVFNFNRTSDAKIHRPMILLKESFMNPDFPLNAHIKLEKELCKEDVFDVRTESSFLDITRDAKFKRGECKYI